MNVVCYRRGLLKQHAACRGPGYEPVDALANGQEAALPVTRMKNAWASPIADDNYWS